MTSPPTGTIFRFRPRGPDNAPELTLPMPAGPATPSADPPRPSAIDLSGKPKAWFMIGRGRVGKTTLLRWAAETADARGGGPVVCAAADPLNRSLRVYRNDVAEPRTSDPADVVNFLQELLGQAMEDKFSVLVDLGGGDTSLHRLLAIMPDLADVMEEAGVAPVAIHVIGSDPHDLVPLASMEAAGFRPRATAIVCNKITGTADQFEPVLRHSVVKAALDRGAVQLWMPALFPDYARMVDARRLQFTAVGNDLGPFAGAGVRGWLKAMATEFGPIATWLP